MDKYLLKNYWGHILRIFLRHFAHLNSSHIVDKYHVVYLFINGSDEAQIVDFQITSLPNVLVDCFKYNVF